MITDQQSASMAESHHSKMKNNYVYHQLKQMDSETGEQFNFFATVLDAGYPYKSQTRYICSLKVVDPSCHHKEGESPNFATVIIYAKRFEDLPVIRRIGDVIRVHRASQRMYNGQLQFNVNVYYNSSWCLFNSLAVPEDQEEEQTDGEDDQMDEDERIKMRQFKPYKFSCKSYSFDIHHEKPIIDSLRQWSSNYFKDCSVLTKDMYRLLKDVKQVLAQTQKSEFDLLCKVIKVFEKDEGNLELKIKDVSQQLWHIAVPKYKFERMSQGDIIRIRCVEVNQTTSRNVLAVKQSTNILRIHPHSRLVKELNQTIEDESDETANLLDDSNIEIIMSPVIASYITNPESRSLPQTKLADLFLAYDTLSEEAKSRNSFKVRMYLVRADPIDSREIVQAICPKCKDCSSTKSLGKKGPGKCQTCKIELKYIFRLQLIVKDSTSQLNKNFYRVLFYSTEDGEGENFFNGTKPTNLYENKEALASIEHQLKALTKFNVWIEAILERQSSFFTIKETQLKMKL